MENIAVNTPITTTILGRNGVVSGLAGEEYGDESGGGVFRESDSKNNNERTRKTTLLLTFLSEVKHMF